MSNYDDIINLNRPVSKHSHLSMESRAAQFAPFAALVGYNNAIKETTRLTDKRIILDEEKKEILNNKLNYINEHIDDMNEITIVYFVKDNTKVGGKYLEKTSVVKRIDLVNQKIKFVDNFIILMKDIIDIRGDIFDE